MSALTVVILAIGLVLIFEGLAYGLFPSGIKRLMAEVLKLPEAQIRHFGLGMALIGALIIYLVY